MNNVSTTQKGLGLGLIMTFVMAAVASSCAAPDAKAGPDKIDPPLPDGGEPDTGIDAPPEEPPAGDPVWAKGFGEATNDQKFFDIALHSPTNSFAMTLGYITAITIPGLNSDAPYISGALDAPMPITVQNVLIVKQNAEANEPQWGVPIRAGAEVLRTTVDMDSEGNVIVAGGFAGKIEIPMMVGPTSAASNGSYDAYIAKLSPTGELMWLKSFGAVGEEYVTDVAVDKMGNIVVVGYATSPQVDFGDGKIIGSVTNKDLFVAKYDSTGKALWALRPGEGAATDILGNNNWREPTATVEVDREEGSIFVGGTYRGTLSFPPEGIEGVAGEDGFLVKLDPNGAGQWHLKFGSANCKQRVRSIAIGPMGEVAVTGAIQGNVTIGEQTLSSYKGTQDLLVAMVAPNGTPKWVQNYGALGDQLGTKVLVDEKGRVFIGGSFTGSIDFFNGGSLMNTTKEAPYTPTDIFVAKFKEDGLPLWAHAWGDSDPKGLVGLQTIESALFWKNDMNENFVVFGGINSGSLDFGGKVQLLKATGFEDAYMMSITY
jgi:hypothetical protein